MFFRKKCFKVLKINSSLLKIFILAVLIAAVSTSLYRYIFDPFNNFDRAGSIEDNGLKQAYLIFIEIQDKTLYLLRDGVCIKKYPIASGRGGLPSPIGCWKVIEKGKWGESFGGRWLGLNVPWGALQEYGSSCDLCHRWILKLVGYFYALVLKDFDFLNQTF